LTQFTCVTAEVFDEGNGRRFAAPARAGQKRAGRERAAHPGLKAQKMGRTMLRRIAKSVLAAGLAVALAVSPALSCTGIMLKTTDGSIVHGRTVEFGFFIDTSIVLVPRGYQFTGETPLGPGKTWSGKYAVVGGIAFNNLAIMDGMNEKGLAAGAFYFPTFAEYAETTPENRAISMSMADFTNWLLTSFSSVGQVKTAIEAGEVAIAPTILKGWPPQAQPFHYVVYDAKGVSIVIEPIGGKLKVYDNPLGVITNSPTFDWHMTNLRNYIALNPRMSRRSRSMG